MTEVNAEAYKPVPVFEAEQISAEYNKHIVIILAWDAVFHLLHTTTFGRRPEQKEPAARLGEYLARIMQGDLSRKIPFEDFRTTSEATYKAKIDDLKKAVGLLWGFWKLDQGLGTTDKHDCGFFTKDNGGCAFCDLKEYVENVLK